MSLDSSIDGIITKMNCPVAEAVHPLISYGLIKSYSSEIADTGQTPAHAPQEMQTSGSIVYCASPEAIAETGQPSAQVPQEMQESEITYAMFANLLY